MHTFQFAILLIAFPKWGTPIMAWQGGQVDEKVWQKWLPNGPILEINTTIYVPLRWLVTKSQCFLLIKSATLITIFWFIYYHLCATFKIFSLTLTGPSIHNRSTPPPWSRYSTFLSLFVSACRLAQSASSRNSWIHVRPSSSDRRQKVPGAGLEDLSSLSEIHQNRRRRLLQYKQRPES